MDRGLKEAAPGAVDFGMAWSYWKRPPWTRWRFIDHKLSKLRCWDFSPRHGELRGEFLPQELLFHLQRQDEGWCLALHSRSGWRQSIDLISDSIAGGVRQRWWWRCPGCGVRRGVLYLAPEQSGYCCRDCASVTYASRREATARRAYARIGIGLPPGVGWRLILGRGREVRHRRLDRIVARADRHAAVVAAVTRASRVLECIIDRGGRQ